MSFYINRVLTYSNGLYIRVFWALLFERFERVINNIKRDINIHSKQTIITDFFLSE